MRHERGEVLRAEERAMSAFGCDCPHSVLEHESDQASPGAHCKVCDCVITREQMLAFMKPPAAAPAAVPGPFRAPAYWMPQERFQLFERRVRALERIAEALERVAPPEPPDAAPPAGLDPRGLRILPK
jgi:hypothetical protein